MRDDDGAPPDKLAHIVAVLRQEPEVRSEWLASVLDEASAQRIEPVERGVATPLPRRWSFRPSVAIAAGLVFAAAGAVGSHLVSTRIGARTAPTVAMVPAGTSARASTVRFSIVAPGAVHVTLVGDFNDWNPASLPMRPSANGDAWEVEVGLAPGRYTYSFVVDGRLARDPSAAESARDDFGVPSSVLLVKGS